MVNPHPFITMLYHEAHKFIECSDTWLQRIGLPAGSYTLDHLCYLVDTQERCRELRLLLDSLGKELSTAEIGGRPIYVWKLASPFAAQSTTGDRFVSVLELPAPKAGSSYTEGFEHAEYVVPETLQALENRCITLGIPVDTRGIHKAHNPEIRIYHTDGWSVKFHAKSLEACILEETQALV